MSWEDQIKVELVDKMGNDLTVANVARVSFKKWKEAKDAGDDKLIHFLAEHQHTTPFRHPHVMVRCSTPIWLARQLGKHQVGMDWNEVSRRYVKETPELFQQEFRKAPDGSIKQGSAGVVKNVPYVQIYDYAMDDIHTIQAALLRWYDEMILQGIAPETIRGYMPQNMMTQWVWTGSLLAFAHVYNLRIDAHAQKEAQVFAQKLGEVVQPLFPVAWSELTGEQ